MISNIDNQLSIFPISPDISTISERLRMKNFARAIKCNVQVYLEKKGGN